MSLSPALARHNTMLVALIVIARHAAQHLDVSRDATLAEIACRLGVSRPYVYQVRDRILDALDTLAAARPGRPRSADAQPETAPSRMADQVKIAVLRFRAENPGSVLPRHYAATFRRFVLELHDAWPEHRTLGEFAAAAEIPLDTLRDWIRADRLGLTPPVPERPKPVVPRDASALARDIADAWRTWAGSTREFVRSQASMFGLVPGQLRRVLILFGLICPRRPRHWPRPPRFRGETEALSPGAMLVTDGKRVELRLAGTNQVVHLNWQGIVDQATGTNTAVVVTDEEDVAGVTRAYEASVRFLGGQAPAGLLIDNKLCQDDGERIARAIRPTDLVRAGEGRPTHKAMIEGAFGKWEQHVGPIVIDDSSPGALHKSIAREVIRAYCAGADHAPHAEYDGHSRIAYLRAFVPSPEQRERDARFLRQLKARLDARRQPARQLPVSRQLLDEAFDCHACLRAKDRSGNLRRYLAYCDPAAVRCALAIFSFRVGQDAIQTKHAHRYLRTLVVSKQEELELLHCETELLDTARRQAELWTEAIEQDLEHLRATAPTPLLLGLAVAEHAAIGGLPIEGAYWTEQLLRIVRDQPALAPRIRRHLNRYYEAPPQRRLHLIERITAVENDVG